MAVYVNNIVIDQGVDFSQSLTVEASTGQILNLTGYAGSSYIRKHAESKNVVAGFGISFANRAKGRVVLSLGSSITSQLKEGRYVYDLILSNTAGLKTVVAEGMVLVRSGITV
jgi:hypothetical protein